MNDTSSLGSFLKTEFTGYGLNVTESAIELSPDWTLARDEYGFVVKTTPDAFILLRRQLESIFPPAKFDSMEEGGKTLIFRADNRHTTVMLNQGDDETGLIVLHWKDPAVQSAISQQQEAAISKLLDDAMSEFHEMMEDAVEETDEVEQSTKIDAALEKGEEILSVLDSAPEKTE